MKDVIRHDDMKDTLYIILYSISYYAKLYYVIHYIYVVGSLAGIVFEANANVMVNSNLAQVVGAAPVQRICFAQGLGHL